MTAVPRVLVSAPSSGHGKTAVAVGLLAAYAAGGLAAAGFKVGPDQTDAAYLGLAANRPGRNLDPRLVGGHRIAPLFAHGAAGADIAVIEGTMGLFDSLAGRSETDSTAAVAAALRTPVVLVVDVGAMGQSVAALVHGFRSYDEMLWLGGVILNRVASDRHEQLLREALDDIGVPVFGALRRGDLPAVLPSRRHGVVPVLYRDVNAYRGVRRLGEALGEAMDLDRLLALARSAPRLPTEPWSPAGALARTGPDQPDAADPTGAPAGAATGAPGSADSGPTGDPRAGTDIPAGIPADIPAGIPVGRTGGPRPVIALAGTRSLSYAYPETAELLTAAGAEVVPVDPLRDEQLPEGTVALVVGGGLPESYAEELSANRRLCIAVAELARTGRPVIAEGAGLLWLAREFDGRPMCGVLDAVGASSERIVVGYREATARAGTVVAQLGARLVGYKQHRGILHPRAGQTPAWTWGGGAPEGYVWRRVHASQLILHWAGAPEIATRLVAAVAAGPAGPPASPTAAGPPAPPPTPPTPADAGPDGGPDAPAHPTPAGSVGPAGTPAPAGDVPA